MSLPTDSLGLLSFAYPAFCALRGVFQLCEDIEKNIQLGAGERGGGTEGVIYVQVVLVCVYEVGVYRPKAAKIWFSTPVESVE